MQVTFTATAEGKARVKLEKTTTAGVLLWDDVGMVSNGDDCSKAVKLKYYPYGQEVGTATANDVAKFGTYTRDAGSGLDYAMNRYYQSWWGRFTTADPYRASGGPADPGSWNRYSYVQGDPVNLYDPGGLLAFPSPSDASIGSTYQYCSYEAGAASFMGGVGLSPFCMGVLAAANASSQEARSAPRCCLAVRSRPLNLLGLDGKSPVGIHSYVTAWVESGVVPTTFGGRRFVIEGYEKEGKLIINSGALSNNGTFFTEGRQEGPTVCGGPEFCLALIGLRKWAADYNQNPQQYDASSGPNCHSVTFTALVIAGVQGYGFKLSQFRPLPTIEAPGWGIFVQPSNLGEP